MIRRSELMVQPVSANVIAGGRGEAASSSSHPVRPNTKVPNASRSWPIDELNSHFTLATLFAPTDGSDLGC